MPKYTAMLPTDCIGQVGTDCAQSLQSFNLGDFLSNSTQVLFFILLFFFSVYGLFLAYHWFSFGTSKHTSVIALATYLLGGAVLFLTLAATL